VTRENLLDVARFQVAVEAELVVGPLELLLGKDGGLVEECAGGAGDADSQLPRDVRGFKSIRAMDSDVAVLVVRRGRDFDRVAPAWDHVPQRGR
jgi:hypothetical protein